MVFVNDRHYTIKNNDMTLLPTKDVPKQGGGGAPVSNRMETGSPDLMMELSKAAMDIESNDENAGGRKKRPVIKVRVNVCVGFLFFSTMPLPAFVVGD